MKELTATETRWLHEPQNAVIGGPNRGQTWNMLDSICRRTKAKSAFLPTGAKSWRDERVVRTDWSRFPGQFGSRPGIHHRAPHCPLRRLSARGVGTPAHPSTHLTPNPSGRTHPR